MVYAGGRAIEGHPRQCKYMRAGLVRCGKWAVKKSDYCATHGGQREANSPDKIVRVGHLPRFYSNKLKGTLRDVVEEALNAPVAEQISVLEELAVSRASASMVVDMLQQAIDQRNGEAMVKAGLLVRETMEKVARLADIAARIESAGPQVGVHTMHLIVNQIVRIAYEVFGEQQSLAEEFERKVRSDVKLPSFGEVEGTSITPDQDVQEMDASIPLLECTDEDDNSEPQS